MSRTKRKDPIDHQSTKPRCITIGREVIDLAPTAKEKRRAHQDRKKWHKPNKTFKKRRGQRDKAKPKNTLRRALAQGKDLDNIVLPDAKRHHEWDWN